MGRVYSDCDSLSLKYGGEVFFWKKKYLLYVDFD